MSIRTPAAVLFSLLAVTACSSNASRQPPARSATAAPTAKGGGLPVRTAVEEELAEVPAARRGLLASALTSADGPCWDPVKHATVLDDLTDAKGVPYVMPFDLAIDLDGDGLPDPVLQVDRDDKNVRYELYVKHAGCAKHLGGMVIDGTLRAGTGFVNGMRVLEVDALCNDSCCPTTQHRELAYDGKSWATRRTWTTDRKCPGQ